MGDFPSYLAELQPHVEATLDRLVPGADERPAELHEAMRYCLFAGGKRIRPALVVLVGDALGVPRATSLVGGAALEMIHTYSLVHDDLPDLDDDSLRRGKPTVHVAYDVATAVLTGDALLTLGLTTLAANPEDLDGERRRQAVALVGEAIGTLGMIGGQVDDLAAEKRWPDDAPAMLEAIHRRKTGALLTACVRLAGVYAGRADLDDDLRRFGELIGLMFQIADDILDVVGTDESLGKTAGKDAAVRKLTYPGLYGLDESRRLLAASHEEALAVARRLPGDSALLASLVDYQAARQA